MMNQSEHKQISEKRPTLKPRSEELGEKLTPKQRLFCDAYRSNGFNATQAARIAGYSKKCPTQIAYQTLKIAEVKEYLNECMKETAEKLRINNYWILRKLKFGVEIAIPDIDENDGEEAIAAKMSKFDFHAGIKGLAEINKMLGNYEPEKKEIDLGEKTKPLVDKYAKEF